MSGATVQVACKTCEQPFTARVADRKRGWGQFCSKSCKATKQTQRFTSGARPKSWKRHDGNSPMIHKTCDTCGAPAINAVHTERGIEWGCAVHHYENTIHPFDSEALGQW